MASGTLIDVVYAPERRLLISPAGYMSKIVGKIMLVLSNVAT